MYWYQCKIGNQYAHLIEDLSKIFLILILIFITTPIFSQNKQEFNNGEDFTRPITRLDLRFKYQEESKLCHNEVFTLRNDIVFTLRNDWSFTTRVDLPYTWVQCKECRCNQIIVSPQIKTKGLADVLVQGLLITPTYEKWTYAVGLRVVFPTATNDDLGSGKYQLLPTAGIKYDLKDWMKGAWCALLVRQDFGVGGDKCRDSIHQTYIQPYFNIDLPRDWFLTSSPEMRYNWNTNNWFIPFDILIGNLINNKIVITLEYKNAIVYDFPLYKQEVEFRVGYFF